MTVRPCLLPCLISVRSKVQLLYGPWVRRWCVSSSVRGRFGVNCSCAGMRWKWSYGYPFGFEFLDASERAFDRALRDDGVAESLESVHPRGNPMSHSTHGGFRLPPTSAARFLPCVPLRCDGVGRFVRFSFGDALGVGQRRTAFSSPTWRFFPSGVIPVSEVPFGSVRPPFGTLGVGQIIVPGCWRSASTACVR